MKKTNKKTKKRTPRVIISNPAVDEKVAKMNLFGKKPKGVKYKFVNVQASLGWRALVVHWAVQGVGFGEVAYYIDDKGTLNVDDEGMGQEFCELLMAKLLKGLKTGKIKLETRLLPNLLETVVKNAKGYRE